MVESAGGATKTASPVGMLQNTIPVSMVVEPAIPSRETAVSERAPQSIVRLSVMVAPA